MDGNQRAASFIRNLNWSEVPDHVKETVRMAFMDGLSAAISGAMTRISQISARYAGEAWQGNQSTIILYNKRSTPAGAAFANACAANGFDTDDVGKYTKGHPGAQIIPVSMALAEARHKSGAEMLTAAVIGYEIAHRTGRCWHDHHDMYQACGSWGSVANAAVASHLMGLDENQIQHALGIAEYHSPNLPMMRDIDDPAMVKHGVGWASFVGITAAELAAGGFTGIPGILGFEQYADWVNDIGERYIMGEPGGILYKEYAACGWTHAALDAGRMLVREHDILVEDIASIRIESFNEMVRLGKKLPVTTEEAQFNTAWPLAVLLLDGEVGPWQMLEHRLNDTRVIALVDRIELVESEELSRLASLMNSGDPRGRYIANITITLNNGETYVSGERSGGIDFSQTWDRQRMEKKFRWLTGYVLSQSRIDQLLEIIWRLDELDKVSDLTTLLRNNGE